MSTAELTTFSLMEPIPGYLVRERLGAGGYGEVWKADAPGGISKAIKIIYGCRDDERAARELAALNRIKQVRHPFLLSLERIERVDGHLVIVTELATSNLKQEFDKCRSAGLTGIPRKELLAHLHDAADALDYISQQFSLQHLDVKPENLLLVGGRIKVADFGLVKDLQDVNSSMIGGMTPVYAAPELFDGRPSVHSDQYSLAIVYQEMLTGTAPFEGRTTAQLASQHLHGRPRLDRLPACDEPAIARALSKDPQQRFSACREMIEALLDATPGARSRAARELQRPKLENPAATPRVETEIISREAIASARSAAARPAGNQTQPTQTPLAIRDLPPLLIDAADVECRPTIFLGIGGLAARTLQTLHRRIASRYVDPAALPALQFLLFETEAESLKAATEGGPAPLKNDSAILLPLRQSADYRNAADGRFHWLSRRWIYNIPRNGQTQGLRPLGRLALIDNLERVIESVTRTVRAAVDPAGIVATAATTALPFRRPAPRVFIVSSTTGGAGSGMVLDFGYIVRQVLRELRLPDDAICGLLAHCTGRNPQTRELCIANAYALLGELNHYSDRQCSFPGDPAAGLNEFSAEDAPFNHSYLVHLGEELDASGFTSAVDTLVTYLFYGTLSSAAAFGDKCRATPSAGQGQEAEAALEGTNDQSATAPSLRNFGVCLLGFTPDDIPRSAAESLCRDLVARWRGNELNQPDPASASLSDPTSLLATQFAHGISADELRAMVAARSETAGVTLDKVLDRFRATLDEQMGDDRRKYLLAAMEELVNNLATQRSFRTQVPPGKVIVEALDAMIRHQGTHESRRLCLESALAAPMEEIAAVAGSEFRQWLLSLVNSPEHRLAGAQRMADTVAEHLRELSRQAAEANQSASHQLRSLKEVLLGDKNDSRNWLRFQGFFSARRLVVDDRLAEYFKLRLHELTLDALCRLVGLLLAQVATVGDKLRNLAADFNRLIEQFSAPCEADEKSNLRAASLQRLAAAEITARKAELLAGMEQVLEEELRQVVTGEIRDARGKLAAALRQTSQTLILNVLKQFAARQATAALQGEAHDPLFEIADALKQALPTHFVGCGGQRRLLVLAPESLVPAVSAQVSGAEQSPAATVQADAGEEMLVCYEVGEQPLRRIADKVLDHRFKAVEAASRLHTRSDVPWSPL